MTPRYKIAVAVAVLVALVSAPSAMFYANRVARQAEQRARQESLDNDRKWCSVVETIDGSYREAPPVTPTGKNLASAIRELRSSLPCPPAPKD
jgi:hypothetical protein